MLGTYHFLPHGRWQKVGRTPTVEKMTFKEETNVKLGKYIFDIESYFENNKYLVFNNSHCLVKISNLHNTSATHPLEKEPLFQER